MEPILTQQTERDPMEMALSIEIIMDIVLSHLKVTDLLSCRKVSKFWNKGASSVLRKRSTMVRTIWNEYHLMGLLECIKLSSDFPFGGLNLTYPWRYKSGEAKEFFRNYGERFSRLCLGFATRWEGELEDLASFVILFPRLSILEVQVSQRPEHHPPVQLLDSAARQEDGVILKLPSVRIIRFLSCCTVDKYILQKILTAASPSVQIECLDAKPGILRELIKGGKLQAVSFIKFRSFNALRSFNPDHCSYKRQLMNEMDELLSIESPWLRKLEFTVFECLSVEGLERILVSSQDTLKELHLDGRWLSEYSWENFPVLAKLTELSLRFDSRFRFESLFRGRHGDKFPALKELHFEGYIGSRNVGRGYSSGLFVVPSVTVLDLKGCVNEDGVEQLAQSFPNTIDIRLDYGSYDNPVQIWGVGKFKCLEKLRIGNVIVRPPTKTCLITMDSFLTGIPVEVCKYLHDQMQLGFSGSPPREISRKNPSILQLKNLKELVVCMQPLDSIDVGGPPFISMVSVRYAFEMMPNLRAKFVYHHRPHLQEQDNAVLEAAFKYVQPSIKLEPSHPEVV